MKQLLVTLAATLLVAGVVFVVLSPGTLNFADQIETQSTELDRIKVTYSNDQNPDQKLEIGQCRPSQKDTVRKAIESVLPYIKTAIDKKNPVLFKKWFGVANGKETDSDVQGRLVDAFVLLKKYEKIYAFRGKWAPECCANESPNEECKNWCTGDINAFVNWWDMDDGSRKSFLSVKLCPKAWTLSLEQLGFTMFHECVHLASKAIDTPEGYTKIAAVQNAQRNPDLARITANNYMLYVIQNGVPNQADYERISDEWGGSTNNDGTCSNNFSNCGEIVDEYGCGDDAWIGSEDNLIKNECCLSCSRSATTQLASPLTP